MKTPITARYPMLSAMSAAKEQMVEQLMVLVGRGQPNPKAYRRMLETRTVEELREMIDEYVN